MSEKDLDECKECSRLLTERTKLYVQWLEARGELAQTPKTSPNYHQRVVEEKEAAGRWLHVGKVIDQQANEHPSHENSNRDTITLNALFRYAARLNLAIQT